MKKLTKAIIAGALVCATAVAGTVYYADSTRKTKTIDVTFDNIQIYMDGELVEPKDANGQRVEPFIYNGTTYLPVRAVGQAVGKDVNWDGVKKVVYLGTKPGDVDNWLNECGPYQYSRGKEYKLTNNEYFMMSGKKYTNGFVLKDIIDVEGYEGWALFNLDGKYSSLTFTVGHVDESAATNATLNVYLDGIIAYTKELKYDDVAQKITIPLNGALQMKIEVCDGQWGHRPSYGFSEGEFVKM